MSDQPDDQVTGGLRVVALLREQGCDLTQERLVSHLFIGPEEPLGDLARDLFMRGFRVLRTSEDVCLAEALSQVDEDWVRSVTAEMTALAAEFSLTYDGWEAAADAPTLN